MYVTNGVMYNKSFPENKTQWRNKLKILLINPWIYDFAAYDHWLKPLGLLYVAQKLKDSEISFHLIDCLDRYHPQLIKYLEHQPKTNEYGCGPYHQQDTSKPFVLKQIPRKYKRYGMPEIVFQQILDGLEFIPDAIFVTSGMTYWYQGVTEVIDIMKNVYPQVPVVLGGTYATLLPEHAKKYTLADHVFPGGNINLLLSFIYNGFKPVPFDIEDNFSYYPAPCYDFYSKLPYIAIRTSRGCPYKCSYCAVNLIQNKLQQKPPEKVVSEIVYFATEKKVKNIAFYDDALLYNSESHIVPILEQISAQNLSLNFHTPNGIAPRQITPKLAKLMKATNFIEPRLSLETIDPDRQKFTGDKVTTAELVKSTKYLHQAGYRNEDVAVYIMTGLPEQSLAEVYDTIHAISGLRTRIRLVEYSPMPGTKDWELCGLSDDTDPLLHNNTVFSYLTTKNSIDIQKIKDLINQHNKSLNL